MKTWGMDLDAHDTIICLPKECAHALDAGCKQPAGVCGNKPCECPEVSWDQKGALIPCMMSEVHHQSVLDGIWCTGVRMSEYCNAALSDFHDACVW